MNINFIKIKVRSIEDFGQLCFYLGSFFLASALPIAGTFYLIALFISISKTQASLFKEKWSLALLTINGLIIFNTIRYNLIESNKINEIHNGSSWFALFNWIPFFLIFIYFQYYLKNKSQRYTFSKIIISGTIPLLISCILQSNFKIYGPWETLGGLIVWFNKVPQTKFDGVAGLFSNPNYTGFWLSATFPFLISLTLKQKFLNYKKFILIAISGLALYFLILTESRNALLNLITSIAFLIGFKKFILFLTIIFLILISLDFLKYFFLIPESFFSLNKIFNFKNISSEFIYFIQNPLQINRVNIWFNSIKLVIQRPIFGYGAATFATYFSLKNKIIHHTHNMPIQIAYEYGILTSIFLTSFIIVLFIKSYQTLKKSNNFDQDFLFNKSWLISFFVIILHHLTDITYYDGKISIFIWLILVGAKCIIDENNKFNLYKK